jgi:hypothetical protein
MAEKSPDEKSELPRATFLPRKSVTQTAIRPVLAHQQRNLSAVEPGWHPQNFTFLKLYHTYRKRLGRRRELHYSFGEEEEERHHMDFAK